MDTHHWTIAPSNIATRACSNYQLEFDLARPQLGLRLSEGKRAIGQLMQVRPIPNHDCQIDDSFARRSDLMVRYSQSPSDRFGFQIDFRAIEGQSLCLPFDDGLDIWLSVQTQLLDTHPTLLLIGQVNGERWSYHDDDGGTCSDGGAVAVTGMTSRSPGTIAMLIHPSDRGQTDWVTSESLAEDCVTLRLFGAFLEKGVIRRARLRCLFSRGSIAKSDLALAYARFAESPLPLTA